MGMVRVCCSNAAVVGVFDETSLCSRVAFGERHQHADPPHPARLLRARGEWPSGCRTSEQRDELATPHGLPSTGQGRTLPHHCVRKLPCIAARLIVEWQSWVKSRIPPERSHVSFRQLLRTYQRTRVQQLCATTGLLHRSNDVRGGAVYSITSSARTRTSGGIFNPSALAALLLTINSSLVGNSTGRSPGLAPLRILFT
jgi:hypothetical protein